MRLESCFFRFCGECYYTRSERLDGSKHDCPPTGSLLWKHRRSMNDSACWGSLSLLGLVSEWGCQVDGGACARSAACKEVGMIEQDTNVARRSRILRVRSHPQLFILGAALNFVTGSCVIQIVSPWHRSLLTGSLSERL